MSGEAAPALKRRVHDYWNAESCGTDVTGAAKFTREYFDEIEAYRYEAEPEIFAFAQFPRWHGRDVLEVGVGAGTDFMQWVRSGARAYGVDLTQEAVDHVRHRLSLYGLEAADVRVGDAESLPFEENRFDLVYSWGVIHHSPNTVTALEELIRVARPGGRIKLMVYHRHSLSVFYKWVYYALLRGKPFRGPGWVMAHHQESPGTKAYTRSEMRDLVFRHPVRLVAMDTTVTRNYDLLLNRPRPFRLAARALASLLGWDRSGFFLRVELEKTGGR